MDEPICWPRLMKRSPSIILILLEPFISSSSAFMIAIILFASAFDVNREITKHKLSEVLKISPLN